MTGGREQMLDSIRRGLGRGPLGEAGKAAIAARLDVHRAGIIPARTRRDPAGLIDLFVELAVGAVATVERLDSPRRIPIAVADYLAAHDLPGDLVMAPDPWLDRLLWAERPKLKLRPGRALATDTTGIARAFAGVAETGTLAMVSSETSPSTISFVPDTHIVVLGASRIVASCEEVFARLRGEAGAAFMPRSLHLITGPSRTKDIEQRIVLGAHGPRRLHILLVDGAET